MIRRIGLQDASFDALEDGFRHKEEAVDEGEQRHKENVGDRYPHKKKDKKMTRSFAKSGRAKIV